MTPPDAAEKTAIWVHNYNPSGAQHPQGYLGNFTSCMTFGSHKLAEKIYIGAHLLSIVHTFA